MHYDRRISGVCFRFYPLRPAAKRIRIIKMIYATLSPVLHTTEITSGNTTEITWWHGRGYKKVSGPEAEGVEEARDIYRCRVRCEVVPRVTGIRFPGAAGPCRGTGPSFTWRTSLDLIHAPLRARRRPAHHRPIRTIALYSRPFVKHPRDHADRWHNAPCAAAPFVPSPFTLPRTEIVPALPFGTGKSLRA